MRITPAYKPTAKLRLLWKAAMNFWKNLCDSAASASIDQIIARFGGSFGAVAVVSSVLFMASLAMLIMYVRLPPHAKVWSTPRSPAPFRADALLQMRMWNLYGWFLGTTCVSSLMSGFAWGSAQGFAGHAFNAEGSNSTSASQLCPPLAAPAKLRFLLAFSHHLFADRKTKVPARTI
jgi:hypothetical protein